MSEKLKPCPFCGGEAELAKKHVYCIDCGSQGFYGDEIDCGDNEPVVRWNTRTPSPAYSDGYLAGLEAAAKRLEEVRIFYDEATVDSLIKYIRHLLVPEKQAVNVEEVARAICAAEGVDPDKVGYAMTDETSSDLGKSYPLWKYRIKAAKAALAAAGVKVEG